MVSVPGDVMLSKEPVAQQMANTPSMKLRLVKAFGKI